MYRYRVYIGGYDKGISTNRILFISDNQLVMLRIGLMDFVQPAMVTQ